MLLCRLFVLTDLCEQCPIAVMFGHMHSVPLTSLSCISCPTGSAVHGLPHTWSQSGYHMGLVMVCCNRIHSPLTHNQRCQDFKQQGLQRFPKVHKFYCCFEVRAFLCPSTSLYLHNWLGVEHVSPSHQAPSVNNASG